MRLNLQNTPTDTDYIRQSAAVGKWSRVGPGLRPDYEMMWPKGGVPPVLLVGYLRTMATAYIHCGVSAGRNNANANLLLFDYSIRSRARARAPRSNVNTI